MVPEGRALRLHLEPGRLEEVGELSVERPVSQWKAATGELLADPTGQSTLLLVRRAEGWLATSRKTDLAAADLGDLDPLGLAVQLMSGESNGFLSPFKNVILVPAGMRATLKGEAVVFPRDDLREFLIANRFTARSWTDGLLVSRDVTEGRLFLSGGLDSIAVLLCYKQANLPLTAAHIDQSGMEHESAFARRAAEHAADEIEVEPFAALAPQRFYSSLEYSPFGRTSNFNLFSGVLERRPPKPFVLNGEMNGLDVGFTDHSDRFRGIRRALYKRIGWRRSFIAGAGLARLLPTQRSAAGKMRILLRSAQTSRSPLLFMLGAALGPKGFPGLATPPFLREEEEFVSSLERRFGVFFPRLDPNSEAFDVDFYLFNYRWILGKSNCAGFQEAAERNRTAARFPFNGLDAILQQVSMAPEETTDKMALKKHFAQVAPELADAIWFEKDNAIGNDPGRWFEPSPEWAQATAKALDSLPDTGFVEPDAFRRFLQSSREGGFANAPAEVPTMRQLNLSSLMFRRVQA
jgi:hypothetical protein